MDKREGEPPRSRLSSHIDADKEWYLSLLDREGQLCHEQEHLRLVLSALKKVYLARHKAKINAAKAAIDAIHEAGSYSPEEYVRLLRMKEEIAKEEEILGGYKHFFEEPYFARMDVIESEEGYFAYYIGKKGDYSLEIVDWRAPLAVKYYQKSCVRFAINGHDYRTVLRRALSVRNGKLLDFKNEYLSVKDVLTPEEIAGRDEEILFDPYLRSILQGRKDDVHIHDIIRTIQEKQYDIITRPERESFVLQGCAGSGKTMILLHRLSYLMYNNEKLRPSDVLVITPSDSFNAFIDELSEVLELERVRTVTMRDYFFQTLKNEGIDLASRFTGDRESRDYLVYLYSAAFPRTLERRIGKIYTDLRGLFTGEECREVAERILDECTGFRTRFARIRNASSRIRRAVFGELKEGKEGGFYYNKPLHGLMGVFLGAEDFLHYVLREAPGTPDRFFTLFSEFFRCIRTISEIGAETFERALRDLSALSSTLDAEISDLMRYRTVSGGKVTFPYADRIRKREEIKEEIALICGVLTDIEDKTALFGEFYGVLRQMSYCADLGKCRDKVDIARWLYRETVKRDKKKFNLQGVYPSDGYALTRMLFCAGRELLPRPAFVFIDEGQDISAGEYDLLKGIHADAAFNIFGDLKQNITPWRGVGDWGTLGFPVYRLEQNYRNTNEIVEYVSGVLNADMVPIGMHGSPVATVELSRLAAFFRGKNGLKAVIAREEDLPRLAKRGFKLLSKEGKLSKKAVNVMSVYESKGLEFSVVAVYPGTMSENELYIACTRALAELAIIRG